MKNVTYCRNTVVTDLQLCCNTITVIKLLYFDMSNGDWCIKYLFLAYVYGHFICQKWIFYTPVKKITIYVQNLRMRYYFFLHMCKKNLLDWNCDSSSWFVYFFLLVSLLKNDHKSISFSCRKWLSGRPTFPKFFEQTKLQPRAIYADITTLVYVLDIASCQDLLSFWFMTYEL